MEPASGSVKLDKKALEGLDARTESTKVPDVDMEDLVEGPPSDNETATSTKTSQSKPEHARGPLREARQAKKALVHKGVVTKEEAERLSPLGGLGYGEEAPKGRLHVVGGPAAAAGGEQEGGPPRQALRRAYGDPGHEGAGDHGPAGPGGRQGAARNQGEVPVLQAAHPDSAAPHLHKGAPPVQLFAGRSHLHECRGREGLASSSEAIRRQELSLPSALEYWGDVERLPTLVKSMHQKRPTQVKFSKSDKAKTHLLPKEEVLAWVSYAPTSPGHLKLHTQLQRDPQLVFQSPEPEGSWWPVVLLQRPADGDYEEIAGVVATGTILIICWYQVLEDGFWVWVMTIEEVDA